MSKFVLTKDGAVVLDRDTSDKVVVTVAGQSVYQFDPAVVAPPPPSGSFPYQKLERAIGAGDTPLFVSCAKGTTYSFPIPLTSNGAGLAAVNGEGANMIGSDGQVEMSLSEVPGDWETAKAIVGTAATTNFGKTTEASHPFYAPAVSPGYGNISLAPLPAGKQYWCNFRVTNMSGGVGVQLSKGS